MTNDNQQQPWGDRVFGPGVVKFIGLICFSIGLFVLVAVQYRVQIRKEAAGHAKASGSPAKGALPTTISSKVPSDTAARDPAAVARGEAIDARVEAEANLRAALKDGPAARLQGLYVSKYGNRLYALCGQMNAKNSFGAFTGFKAFVASPNSEIPPLIEDEAVGLYEGLSASDFRVAKRQFCSDLVYRF